MKRELLIAYFSEKPYLSPEQAGAIAEKFSPLSLEKRDVLLRTGELWNSVVYIETGLLRLYYLTEQGKEFNKGFFAENELLWPMAPLARAQASLFTIESVESCVLWHIPFEQFQQSIALYVPWAEFALPYVERLVDQKFFREYQFLVQDAKTRYAQLKEELPTLIDRLPDYHLASYLGITNVALSRLKLK